MERRSVGFFLSLPIFISPSSSTFVCCPEWEIARPVASSFRFSVSSHVLISQLSKEPPFSPKLLLPSRPFRLSFAWFQLSPSSTFCITVRARLFSINQICPAQDRSFADRDFTSPFSHRISILSLSSYPRLLPPPHISSSPHSLSPPPPHPLPLFLFLSPSLIF